MNFLISIIIRVVFVGLINFCIEYVPKFARFCSRSASLSFHTALRMLIAPHVTPQGHRRYGDYKSSEGYIALKDESYAVLPRWSSDAVSKLK